TTLRQTMIIPRFTIEQNNDFVIVVARTPYIRANEADFYLMDDQFKFYCKPYFLRLTFPHRIVENGKEKASYNVDTQEFTFQLPKETSGQHFPDLDMITKLLDKKKSSEGGAKIQLVDGQEIDQVDGDDEDEEAGDYEGEEWEFEQHQQS
ncbi:hypothetical protein SAMD00019534_031800, partial [Acytostelium subglobosum LB1]|uniref:hypothetical protein n=1 Tax=Acytostelium subglobosum LB1 TaxID=1410327 RepID=UPI000644D0E5